MTHFKVLSQRTTLLFCLLFLSSEQFGYSQQINSAAFKKRVDKELYGSATNTKLLEIANSYSNNSFVSKPEFVKGFKYLCSKGESLDLDSKYEVFVIAAKKFQAHQCYEDAFYYLYKTDKGIKEKPPVDTSFYPFFHETFGLSLYYFRRNGEAKQHLFRALKSKGWDYHQRIGIQNSIGLVYRNEENIDSARYYFNNALIQAKKYNDIGWIGVLSGNLGHLLFLQGDYDAALPLITYDYESGQKINQVGSSINAAEILIQIKIKQGKIAEAEKILARVEELVKTIPYSLEEYRVLYKSRLAVYQTIGNYKEALDCYKQVTLFQDTIGARKTEENLQKMEFQINFEQKQSELSLIQERERFNEWMIVILSLLVGLIVVIFILIIRGIARRRKRENQLLELKKERVERELAHAEKEMRSILSNMIEKNALIEELSAEIEGFQNNNDSKFDEERSKMLVRLQSITLLTDDDWLEFKKLFERLNPNFFTQLMNAAPDLTNAEIRLVTLIKLNLSNLEMARVLGISPDSVRKTALRLRKKWNIDQQEDLVKFVLNL